MDIIRTLSIAALFFVGGLHAQTNESSRVVSHGLDRLDDSPAFSPIGITTPPISPVRTMAEWEELQALVITWRGFSSILTEIVRVARQECTVVICCQDQAAVNAAKNTLVANGVDISSKVVFLIAKNDSIWVRDYGPNCVYANDVDSLYFVDWVYNRVDRPVDDTIATKLAPYFGVPLYSTSAAPTDLVNTGGNFMSDGISTAFASKLILNENKSGNIYGVSSKTEPQIDGILSDFMGIDRYIKMTTLPYDKIHHIDMHMKLLDEETLLVGKYPTGIADGPQIEANILYVLNNFQSAFGTPYKVVRIPMPPDAEGLYPDENGRYRTYANAVFVNKTIILPTYETQYDTTALRIWRETMPGYKVVGVDCNNIIPYSGAIHCITKEIGVSDPLRIVHKPIDGVLQNAFGPNHYTVTALVQHRSGIASAYVHYRRKTSNIWESVAMTPSTHPDSLSYWTGLIPKQEGFFDSLYYYVEAQANNGKTQTRPIVSPQGAWKFLIQANVSGVETLPQAELLEIFPNPASSITVIPVRSNDNTLGNLQIYNNLGQLAQTVFTGEIPAGDTNYFLDASQLASGAYFVRLQTGGQTSMKKLVVR